VTALYNIAMQCPLAGGNSVIRARALYALINDDMTYDDRATCFSEGISIKQPSNFIRTPKIKVYPNPANESMSLVYDIEENSSGTFALINTVGQLIFEFKLKGGKQNTEVSTADFKPGVYYYQVYNNDAPIYSGKLVIIH
jgi:hypothetical protein